MEMAKIKNNHEKQTIHTLIEIAKSKYQLKISRYLPSMLAHYLYNLNNKSINFHEYRWEYREILGSLFAQEYLFAIEATQIIQTDFQVLLNNQDLLFLTEIMICSEWDLSIMSHDQEKLIDIMLFLLKNISLFGGLPVAYLYKQEKGLTNHIKFLAYRILKKRIDKDDSDDEIYFHIKEKYGKIFALANRMRGYISETYHFDLSNNETSYLSLQVLRSQLRYQHSDKE